jgi:aldose 1-epimerase
MPLALVRVLPRYLGLPAGLIASFIVSAASAESATITQKPFGATLAGLPATLYTMRNRAGMEARITNYGGIVTYLSAPDRHGHYADVVLGYDTLESYLKASPYFGALVGRYANRIAHAAFTLDGVRYQLARNDGSNTLHGGTVGFDKKVWDVKEAVLTAHGPRLTLTYLSHDGEEGYPGNLKITAVYTLTDDNALRLDYSATSDKKTVLNLTQHSYFNLRGRGDILGHIVQINADQFTPVDATLIPTGELRSVAGTFFDFREPAAIGAHIDAGDEQLRFGKGYDHNWVIRKPNGTLALMAKVYEPDTGRVLEVSSSEPGLQFYSGNMLDGSLKGKGGWTYTARSAFTMEPQHYPDSPNHADFPSVVLAPGGTYHNTIVYRFSAR